MHALIKSNVILIFLLIFYIFIYINIKSQININKVNNEINFDNYQLLLEKKIEETFKNKGYVNINKVEDQINHKIKNYKQNKVKKNEINIGIQLDSNFTLQAMITFASILDTQNDNTTIRFHIAVVLNFPILEMLKIYSLKKKIRNDTEFNFYNASRVEKDLKGLNTKGPGAVAKLLLPQLLPDDIKKLLILDTGDLIVLRDLTEQYNWEMKDYFYVGVPGGRVGKLSLITKQIYKSYINTGSFLVNVTKVKYENMYDKFVKYKGYYNSSIGDQDLLNDVAIGKVGMYPIKFGFYSPFIDDNTQYVPVYNRIHPNIRKYFPHNLTEYLKLGYRPNIIHQWNGKWSKGSGLTIFRKIAQNYIRYAGIWEETCKKFPGYCI